MMTEFQCERFFKKQVIFPYPLKKQILLGINEHEEMRILLCPVPGKSSQCLYEALND